MQIDYAGEEIERMEETKLKWDRNYRSSLGLIYSCWRRCESCPVEVETKKMWVRNGVFDFI